MCIFEQKVDVGLCVLEGEWLVSEGHVVAWKEGEGEGGQGRQREAIVECVEVCFLFKTFVRNMQGLRKM